MVCIWIFEGEKKCIASDLIYYLKLGAMGANVTGTSFFFIISTDPQISHKECEPAIMSQKKPLGSQPKEWLYTTTTIVVVVFPQSQCHCENVVGQIAHRYHPSAQLYLRYISMILSLGNFGHSVHC
jgi:hypothetical protein